MAIYNVGPRVGSCWGVIKISKYLVADAVLDMDGGFSSIVLVLESLRIAIDKPAIRRPQVMIMGV